MIFQQGLHQGLNERLYPLRVHPGAASVLVGTDSMSASPVSRVILWHTQQPRQLQ